MSLVTLTIVQRGGRERINDKEDCILRKLKCKTELKAEGEEGRLRRKKEGRRQSRQRDTQVNPM